MKQWLPALLLLLPLPAQAFPATVVWVTDGDTVTVLDAGREEQVRVFGIDAPEHDQPGGADATRDLIRLVYGKAVEVGVPPGERQFPVSYGRKVATLTLPDGTDVGLVMLQLGDAWAYDHYHPPRSYDAAMIQAAKAHRGLWRDANPVMPWRWRHEH